MATTRDEIREWLKRARDNGATHMLVVCDTFDYEDYPVEVTKDQNAHEVFAEYQGKEMSRVMEVYNLNLDIEKQLNEHRAFNF